MTVQRPTVLVEGDISWSQEGLTAKGHGPEGQLLNPAQLKTGTSLQLHLRLPHEDAALSIPLAIVQWVYGRRVGVEFLVMTDETQTRLRRFLEARTVSHLLCPELEGQQLVLTV